MKNNTYKVIGVMSGTSLDGIDLAYIKFTLDKTWSFEIVSAETLSYTDDWVETLQNLVTFSSEKLPEIDTNYTNYLATVINRFVENNNIEDIDAICSHGHTALHQPKNGLTYQIGNRKALALLTGYQVVCDFRVQDVELGGQGAPLVPIGDQLLFSEYDFCLNLGGFANISSEINNQRIAYDICPVNIVMNHYVKQLGFNYDAEGKIAATGKVNIELLNALNDLDFYQKTFPKSLGLEWVKACVLPLINSFQLEIKDILRTVVEHIAIQIALVVNKETKATLFITGGGVYNTFLIDQLKTLTQHKIIIPTRTIVEFKEALIFGFLGVLKLRGEVNCLSSVTGAIRNHSSGKIYKP